MNSVLPACSIRKLVHYIFFYSLFNGFIKTKQKKRKTKKKQAPQNGGPGSRFSRGSRTARTGVPGLRSSSACAQLSSPPSEEPRLVAIARTRCVRCAHTCRRVSSVCACVHNTQLPRPPSIALRCRKTDVCKLGMGIKNLFFCFFCLFFVLFF